MKSAYFLILRNSIWLLAILWTKCFFFLKRIFYSYKCVDGCLEIRERKGRRGEKVKRRVKAFQNWPVRRSSEKMSLSAGIKDPVADLSWWNYLHWNVTKCMRYNDAKTAWWTMPCSSSYFLSFQRFILEILVNDQPYNFILSFFFNSNFQARSTQLNSEQSAGQWSASWLQFSSSPRLFSSMLYILIEKKVG